MEPTSQYFFIMERPVGSRIWTYAAMACDLEAANSKAIAICDENKTCARIVSAFLPDSVDTGSRYAVLLGGDEYVINSGEGGAA